ncbi:MAG: hypothetical protein WBB73_13925 [Candidatus Aminicenantaceae bacterium]
MIKKPHIIGSIVIVAAFAFVLVTTGITQQMTTQSIKSHIEALWATSGHSNAEGEAFRHWDEDGEVSASCSKCHASEGYAYFIQNDGATMAVHPEQEGITCQACHSDPDSGTLRNHSDVEFPSGVVVEGLGPEALCSECHQGRMSGPGVDEYIAGRAAEGEDEDTVNSRYSFRNIHYHAAAATQFGTVVKGGYEYSGKMYDARFSHVTGYNACYTCHDPHSLEVDLGPCNTCHVGLQDKHDLRYYGSFVDYDGDGDMEEGIYWEIETLKEKEYAVLQAYCKEVAGVPIGYNAHAYPYFFVDTNGNGIIEEDETTSYTSFTQRSLKGSYNYQVALKDANGWAHGGKYIIQLLYDSIEDMNSALDNPISMAGMHRDDEGHFDGSTEAWRHWDGDEGVQTSCAKCHSATGLQEFVQTGAIAEAPPLANGMLCTTCHFSGPPSLTRIEEVTFPSGAIVTLGDNSNYCLECHQGRGSKYTILNKVNGGDPPYSFSNIHYYPAGASLFGTEVEGGFEYGGKTYVGRNLYPNHMGKFDTCVECHMGSMSENKPFDYTGEMHSVHTPDPRDCVYCHGYDISQPNPGADPDKFTFHGIRPASIPDLNANGDITESIQDEIFGLEEDLYAQMQAYGNKIGAPIAYDTHSYPYFFNDLNGNSIVDPEEAERTNGYLFNAKMLKAGYNYQFSKKEPGAFIHNPIYMGQLLSDSIKDLGGTKNYFWR